MEKVRLCLDELHVQSFATTGAADEHRGHRARLRRLRVVPRQQLPVM
jgi:hypothetical protein